MPQNRKREGTRMNATVKSQSYRHFEARPLSPYIGAELHGIDLREPPSDAVIADVRQAMEPLFTTSTSGERSGLGFTVMQQFSDGVAVRSKPGRGTSVTLKKRLISPDAEKKSDRKGR